MTSSLTTSSIQNECARDNSRSVHTVQIHYMFVRGLYHNYAYDMISYDGSVSQHSGFHLDNAGRVFTHSCPNNAHYFGVFAAAVFPIINLLGCSVMFGLLARKFSRGGIFGRRLGLFSFSHRYKLFFECFFVVFKVSKVDGLFWLLWLLILVWL